MLGITPAAIWVRSWTSTTLTVLPQLTAGQLASAALAAAAWSESSSSQPWDPWVNAWVDCCVKQMAAAVEVPPGTAATALVDLGRLAVAGVKLGAGGLKSQPASSSTTSSSSKAGESNPSGAAGSEEGKDGQEEQQQDDGNSSSSSSEASTSSVVTPGQPWSKVLLTAAGKVADAAAADLAAAQAAAAEALVQPAAESEAVSTNTDGSAGSNGRSSSSSTPPAVPSLAPAAAELCWALSRLAWSDGFDRSNAGQTVAQLAAVAGPSLERCSGCGLTQLVEALQSWAIHPGVYRCWWQQQLPVCITACSA